MPTPSSPMISENIKRAPDNYYTDTPRKKQFLVNAYLDKQVIDSLTEELAAAQARIKELDAELEKRRNFGTSLTPLNRKNNEQFTPRKTSDRFTSLNRKNIEQFTPFKLPLGSPSLCDQLIYNDESLSDEEIICTESTEEQNASKIQNHFVSESELSTLAHVNKKLEQVALENVSLHQKITDQHEQIQKLEQMKLAMSASLDLSNFKYRQIASEAANLHKAIDMIEKGFNKQIEAIAEEHASIVNDLEKEHMKAMETFKKDLLERVRRKEEVSMKELREENLKLMVQNEELIHLNRKKDMNDSVEKKILKVQETNCKQQ